MMGNITAKQLNIVVSKARDMGISASAFDEIYKLCGGDYYSILYFLNESNHNLSNH